MTPIERLQAAIALLEKQRSATEPVRPDSRWVVDYELAEGMGLIHVLDSHNGGHDGSIVATATSEASAQLIVTLHRTIDAQISILRAALARADVKIAGGGVSHAVWWHTRYPLELADAILGSDS